MLAIESNLSGVIGQLERLQAALPAAAEEALAPGLWLAEAQSVARRTMEGLATAAERPHVAGFVATVVAGVLTGGGLTLGMHEPGGGSTTLPEAQAARGAVSASDLWSNLFLGKVQQFEDLILKWVETAEDEGGKRRDARDAGKSDEEIAAGISWIMLSPAPTAKVLEARRRLAPHIEEFVRRVMASRGISPERVAECLRAVLAAWRQMVRDGYAARVRNQLRKRAGRLL
jgi:hypothetical protein